MKDNYRRAMIARGDYKYETQIEAEKLAIKRYGREFSDLGESKQHGLLNEALFDWTEKQAAKAASLANATKERIN
jgi:hypothetical protein